MGIIRLSDEEVFGTDSQEYEILVNAALELKKDRKSTRLNSSH